MYIAMAHFKVELGSEAAFGRSGASVRRTSRRSQASSNSICFAARRATITRSIPRIPLGVRAPTSGLGQNRKPSTPLTRTPGTMRHFILGIRISKALSR